jgi:outer membrane protein
MFKKILLFCFFVCGFCLAPASADEVFSLKAGYIQLNADGQFSVTADGLTGTVIDVDDDLRLDDSEEIFFDAGLQLGSFRFSLSYLPVSSSGSAQLNKDIDFNGQTFPVNAQINSDLDIDIYEAGVAWYLVNFDDLPARIQLGPELAVKYIDASVAIADSSTSTSDSVQIPLPTVGLRGRIAFADFVGITARGNYMSYNNNSLLDVDAQVELSPIPLVGVYLGYRYLDVDFDEDDVVIDVTFDGPYAGALFRF